MGMEEVLRGEEMGKREWRERDGSGERYGRV